MQTRAVFIVGCTGCGKGALGHELARRMSGEIISLDSMKIYRRMDIGTAKPNVEVRNDIPHHLIDVIEPSEEFSVARYLELADTALDAILQRGRSALFVGGTALYLMSMIEGLFEGPGADENIRTQLRERADVEGPGALHEELKRIDPTAADRIHPNDLRRIIRALEVFQLTGRPISELQVQWDNPASDDEKIDDGFRIFGLRRDREDQSGRINLRVRAMVEAGLVDEVRSLISEPLPMSPTARKAVGYAEIIRHLDGVDGEISLADAIEMIKINTRHFAKSQRTWFRRIRRVDWIDVGCDATVVDLADEVQQRLDAYGCHH